MDRSTRLSGIDWQDFANRLLQRHYGPGEYQKIPDHDKGDAGLEGFTNSGEAYQIYGPEEPLTTGERFKKHRSKMTTDVRKFIGNQKTLQKLLGTVKIRRWVLLVPTYDSKEIVGHASKKTKEVKTAELPYVTDDFQVVVEDEEAFSVEREELLRGRLANVEIVAGDIKDADMSQWVGNHDPLIQDLDGKLTRLPTLQSTEQRHEFRNQIIRHFLRGQNVLEELRKYPESYEKIHTAKSEQERYLVAKSLLTTKTPAGYLETSLDKIRMSMRENVPAVSSHTIEAVAWEAISDWLIRCPLNFPAGN